MKNVWFELDSDDTSNIDDAASYVLEEFRKVGADILPAEAKGQRDGGALMIGIAIVGGAASLAQIVSTIHTVTQKPRVKVIVIDEKGKRIPLPSGITKEKIEATITDETDTGGE
jgi:hypothetical protein